MKNENMYLSLVDEYSDMVTRLCIIHTGNMTNAEDCYQNVFSSFSRNLKKVIFQTRTDMVFILEDNSYVNGQGTVNTQRCRLGIDNDGQLINIDSLSKIVLCGKEYIFN